MRRLLRRFVGFFRRCAGRFTPPPLRILLEFCVRTRYGYRQYARLLRKYGVRIVYLQYYRGTGDVYLAAAYLKYLDETSDRSDREQERSVFAVNGQSAYHVAELFRTEGTEIAVLREIQARAVLWLYRFLGGENLRVRILHYMDSLPMYQCFLIFLAGLNGIGFMDLYRAAVFGDEKITLPPPAWDTDSRWTEEIFRRYRLKKGRTILLAPTARSIAEGPDEGFWELLAQRLSAMGYCVCTNLSHPKETAVKDTVGIIIPYREMDRFLQAAGTLIGYRSGLCDLAAAVPCRKIILYPKDTWPLYGGLGIGTTKDIFSLNKMGLCNDAIELEYDRSGRDGMLDAVVGMVE